MLVLVWYTELIETDGNFAANTSKSRKKKSLKLSPIFHAIYIAALISSNISVLLEQCRRIEKSGSGAVVFGLMPLGAVHFCGCELVPHETTTRGCSIGLAVRSWGGV